MSEIDLDDLLFVLNDQSFKEFLVLLEISNEHKEGFLRLLALKAPWENHEKQ